MEENTPLFDCLVCMGLLGGGKGLEETGPRKGVPRKGVSREGAGVNADGWVGPHGEMHS